MKNKNAHVLLVGYSHGHIYKIIDHFLPSRLYLFSSKNLHQEIEPLLTELKDRKITYSLYWIEPFKKNSLIKIINKIIEVGKNQMTTNLDEKLYIGLTGGTNLMASGAGIASTILKCSSHYVVKDKEEILIFDNILKCIQLQNQ